MNDKRKVFTDALETLGTIIGPNEKRDAIHLAVEPVMAKHHLVAGQPVTADGYAVKDGPTKFVGIVDPFLNKEVQPGEYFWLVVYPRQITSLRHVWSHPDFPDTSEVTAISGTKNEEDDREAVLKRANSWMWCFKNKIGAHEYDLEEFILSVQQNLREELGEDKLIWCGEDAVEDFKIFEEYFPKEYDEDMKNFWKYYEIITNTKVSEEIKEKAYFSCSC